MTTITYGTSPTLLNGKMIVIRNPLLSDEHQIENRAIYRRSRDHTFYGYTKNTVERLVMQFSDMNRATVNGVVAFLKRSTWPQTVTLDNGDVWTGIITNDFDSSHVGNINSPFTLILEGTITTESFPTG